MNPLAILLSLTPCFALAQTPEQLFHRYPNAYPYEIPSKKLGIAWTNLPWLDKSNEFTKARAELDAQFAQLRLNAEQRLLDLETDALAHQKDALAQFRWGYQGSLMAASDAEHGISRWRTSTGRRKRGQIRWALALAPNPRNPEYDRLRYIFEAGESPAAQFRELGKRLLLKWPNDEPVLRSQALNLVHSTNPIDVDKAIAITDQFLKRHPTRLREIGQKGDIHRAAWVYLHRKADGLATIEWTERYLSRAELHPLTRQAFQRGNDSIRNELKKTSPSRRLGENQ